MINEILNKACLLCGKANRFHKIFWSPYEECYVRQTIDIDFNGQPLVPSRDHYPVIDNLKYLEYLYESRNH